MNVKFSSRAARDFENQIAYLLEQGAAAGAKRLSKRVLSFIDDFLAQYPKAGRHIAELDIYEIWVPQTRFVLFYRIELGGIRILALFHAAQDRSNFEVGE